MHLFDRVKEVIASWHSHSCHVKNSINRTNEDRRIICITWDPEHKKTHFTLTAYTHARESRPRTTSETSTHAVWIAMVMKGASSYSSGSVCISDNGKLSLSAYSTCSHCETWHWEDSEVTPDTLGSILNIKCFIFKSEELYNIRLKA